MKHECNNLIVSCMDFRFHEAICEWVKENNMVGDYDLISLAGAQKVLVDPNTKDFFFKQLEISVKLHKTKNVILLAHQDCGAYGGSKAFESWTEEKAKYMEDLTEAELAIKNIYPEIKVRKMILEWKVNFGEV